MKEKLKVFIKNNCYIFLMILPFLIMDGGLRIIGRNISYFRSAMVLPGILFVVIWVGLIAGICAGLKRVAARAVYSIFFLVFFVLFLTNGIYYSMTGYFFSFHLLMSAEEGSAYILDAILGAGWLTYFFAALAVFAFLVAFICIPKREKINLKCTLITVAVFLIMHIVTPFCFGPANSGLEWDTWRNPHNVYNNFNDSNKCIKICGLFEYSVRDFYITFLKPDEPEDPEEIAFLEDYYSTETIHETNSMTGMFEGKNVIFLQLEGIDDWMLTEEDTPNLYQLMSEGINFTDHYSYFNGGGSTFNSELAVNTGLITPISYTQNAYTFNSNLFTASLPKLFHERGYIVNAFHMNTEEYYSRGINYKNWGYENYYGLKDMCSYNDISYELDRELVENELFYDLLFCKEEPFMHYIITYTPHTPFTNTKGIGAYLAKDLYGDDVPEMNEEAVAKMFAGETDRMVGELIQGLKDNGLYENTVIVAFTDHYLYTLNDKSILDKYKDTETNLINHTPFFIWSCDTEAYSFHKTNSQLDILPTVLNLFGIEYVEEYYMGNDIFDEDYEGYVFFSDYSWYDGSIYCNSSEGAIVPVKSGEGESVTDDTRAAELDALINKIIKVNDLTLKYDYQRRITK